MFDWILRPLGWILEKFNSWTGSYLLAVFLFALLFKIILFPFSLKQQKSQLKQAKLQPKVAAIQKKYKGRTDQESQQKMQQETMDMYQSEGFNPMGGCLPMLLQLPIIMALYSIIQNPLHYICGVAKDAVNVVLKAAQEITGTAYGYSLAVMQDLKLRWDEIYAKVAEIAGDTDVSSFTGLQVGDLPDFRVFGLNLSARPIDAMKSEGWYYILIPVLTFVIVFLSMKLTRKLSYVQVQPDAQSAGCSNWIMDLMSPVMSTFFAFTLPSLLGIYWIFNNLLGVLQQVILRAMYPAPVFTEADYKAAERALRGKGPKTPEADSRVIPGKKYVSLHHIDDDDEIDLPVAPAPGDDDDDDDAPAAPRLKDESDRPAEKKKKKK